mmetsp:Transcript_17292/g.47631  ORF Transcript_17292/g.47631 Transcript_17292/m.47631 type:complete len:532 (-) Transcript_17292:3048-4643(-)
MKFTALLLLSLSLSLSSWFMAAEAARKTRSNDLRSLDYSVFPRRTEEEAAVFEWGHSAIISALDASVATFGPQTSQAALLEVECMPILASPVNGAMRDAEGVRQVTALRNADEVHGNIVVMTNNGGLSGVEMAKIAKLSGAAALLVVNIDEKRPDDIYRLGVLDGEETDAEDIDIPVVMISLNSANVLTTATVEPHMEQKDIVNNGMPDRIRLYAGGDRPFFEDVEPLRPTLYLIHNLLTSTEADALVDSAGTKVEPLVEGVTDGLQYNTQPQNYPGVESVMLWQGALASPAQKAIEERIEQVTGFPATHFSDFIVDKLGPGAHWKPHYDEEGQSSTTPIATIIVFLTDEGNADSGAVVYPGSSKKSIKVLPQKGLAIVHHNMDDKDQLDASTLHAMLPIAEGETVYVARKYVFEQPVSKSRRMALPAFALLGGGKLPSFVVSFYDLMVDNLGVKDGNIYFDKACVFLPMLVVLLLAQFVVNYIKDQILEPSSSSSSSSSSSNSDKSKTGKKSSSGKSDKKSKKSKKGKSD